MKDFKKRGIKFWIWGGVFFLTAMSLQNPQASAFGFHKTFRIGEQKKSNVEATVWSGGPMHDPQANAREHWQKHGQEFPELKNIQDYIAKAHAFYKKPPRGALRKRKSNGELMIYEPATRTFAVYSRNGTPQSMFRPARGIQYWNRQEGEPVA